MMKLLIALLFFVNASAVEDDKWTITVFHTGGPDFEPQRDCEILMEFCHANMPQCVEWAMKEYTFPTETMRAEITLGPTEHEGTTLACVDYENFETGGATPSGLIKDATGQIEGVKFEASHPYVIETLQPMTKDDAFCAHFEKVDLRKALKWMDHTQLGQLHLPWYVVPGAEHGKDPQVYEGLDTCADGGKIYSTDTNTVIQCSKIVCGGKEVEESSDVKKMSVIAQCQDEYHFAVAYFTATKACLSKYPDEYDQAGGVTLEQALGEQGHSESEIKAIIDDLHPATRTLHFWGDADQAVRLNPEYEDFRERKWLNYEMRDNAEHQPTPRMFQHLMGAEQDMMQSIRKCSLDTQDKGENCENKAVLPWDVYQVMMLEREQRDANPEMSTVTSQAENLQVDVSKESEDAKVSVDTAEKDLEVAQESVEDAKEKVEAAEKDLETKERAGAPKESVEDAKEIVEDAEKDLKAAKDSAEDAKEELKDAEAEKDAASFSYPIWTVIISFLVMMLGGLYMFVI